MDSLYEVRGDPLEHTEISAQYPAKVVAMRKRLEELKETAFTPVRCSDVCDDGFGNIACGKNCGDPRACATAQANGGFCALRCLAIPFAHDADALGGLAGGPFIDV